MHPEVCLCPACFLELNRASLEPKQAAGKAPGPVVRVPSSAFGRRTLEQAGQWRVWELYRSSSASLFGSPRSAPNAGLGTGPPPARASNHCRNAVTNLQQPTPVLFDTVASACLGPPYSDTSHRAQEAAHQVPFCVSHMRKG